MNHSCGPNTQPKRQQGRVEFYSPRDIAPGEELTADYGETHHEGRLRCCCGAPSAKDSCEQEQDQGAGHPLCRRRFRDHGRRTRDRGRATEIGLVIIEDGQIVDQYESLMWTGAPIPERIQALTGITPHMLDSAPKAADVMREACARGAMPA